MIADLDDLLTALYVLADEILPRRPRARRRPPITDAELVCLAVAQVLLDCPSERRFLRFARRRLGHLFPYLPKQPGYNKRVRALAGQIALVLGVLARSSPSWCDNVRLLDSTPVPCAASRETVKRSDFAGYASYGYCRSHSRYFWGFRLMLLCAPDGMPIAFDLFPANLPERDAAAEILKRVELDGYTIIADKGFAGADFEQLVAEPRRPPCCARTARTNATVTARSARSANGSSRSSTPSRASSRSRITARTPCTASPSASRNACSRSPPACGTTGRSTNPDATSPPTTTDRNGIGHLAGVTSRPTAR